MFPLVFRHSRFAVLALALGALSGCAFEPVPPCPEVRIDDATARLTQFKEAGTESITDVMYQAEIVAYDGTCRFNDDGVEVVMDLDMVVSGGPAVEPGPVDLYYFVAIPRFYPQAAGKKVFRRTYRVPSGGARQDRITESNVRIFIPLEDNLTAAGYDIYLGFQLTDAQLRYNRTQSR
jgi:hypothetical protein